MHLTANVDVAGRIRHAGGPTHYRSAPIEDVPMGNYATLDEGDSTARVGYRSGLALADGFDEIALLGGTVVTIFHSSVASTDAALAVARERWSGPVAIYPEAERRDYVDAYRDRTVQTRLTPEEFLAKAEAWVAQGVQIVGGCCGVELEYIKPLREFLPTHIPD